MRHDVVVAGAGIWGCTVARVLAEAGRRVLVLEERSAVGGNCRTEDVDGIETHIYGSHIFHTKSGEVWKFLNRFTAFNTYQHKVLAKHAGRTYPMPLGLALVNAFYGKDLAPSELPGFIAREAGREATDSPRNFEEQAVNFVGRPLYEAFIRNYTMKQWATDPKNLDAAIIRRLPVRASYDTNYFSDPWQGIPADGYNALFERLLDHANIEVRCGVTFVPGAFPAGQPVFYSGPVDRLFGYRFGELPWRSLRFESETVDVADWQGTSVMNYTDADVPFTRIHEYKHFHPERADVMATGKSVICREYPVTWKRGDEPYYPVNNAQSAALAAKYRGEAAKIPGLVVGGRLGEYKYLDMDQSVLSALRTAGEWLSGNAETNEK